MLLNSTPRLMCMDHIIECYDRALDPGPDCKFAFRLARLVSSRRAGPADAGASAPLTAGTPSLPPVCAALSLIVTFDPYALLL